MFKRVPLKESSNIKQVDYNLEDSVLRVEFKSNMVYYYFQVPREAVNSWVDISSGPDQSVGSSFHNIIKKGGFEYKKAK